MSGLRGRDLRRPEPPAVAMALRATAFAAPDLLTGEWAIGGSARR